MGRLIDLTGRTFGRWTVLGLRPIRSRSGEALWDCRCIDGVVRSVPGSCLRNGTSVSCGCFRKESRTTHGHGGNGNFTAAYQSWKSMLQRCFNSNNRAYCHYGERGITVCERWLVFENFYADMRDPPDGLSIDRINNDGDYEPGNCKWSTRAEQVRNRRPLKRKPRRSKLEDLQAFAASLARAASEAHR